MTFGFRSVHVRTDDGSRGWDEQVPLDRIVVTAAAREIPQPLIEQLKNGGRMFIPVGPPDAVQQVSMVEKSEASETAMREIMPVRFTELETA